MAEFFAFIIFLIILAPILAVLVGTAVAVLFTGATVLIGAVAGLASLYGTNE